MSLLQELGGRDAVEAVVAGFYERVMADAQLAPYFRNVSMSRLHQHQVDFFVAALGGGTDIYKGKDMVTAHRGLNITDQAFDAVAGHLVATLKSLGVGQGHIDQVIGLIAPLRSVVVTAPAAKVAAR
jgi:hemoglobin